MTSPRRTDPARSRNGLPGATPYTYRGSQPWVPGDSASAAAARQAREALGEAIRAARKASGKQQATLARLAQMSAARWSGIEGGDYARPEVLARVAEALGTTVEALRGGTT